MHLFQTQPEHLCIDTHIQYTFFQTQKPNKAQARNNSNIYDSTLCNPPLICVHRSYAYICVLYIGLQYVGMRDAESKRGFTMKKVLLIADFADERASAR